MEKENQSYKLKPRKLGDEWEGWAGSIEENLGDLNTSRSLFLSLLFIANFMLFIGIWAVSLLVVKKLLISYEGIYFFFNWVIISVTMIYFIYFVLLSLTLIVKKPYAFYLKDKQFADLFSVKFAIAVGNKIGISNDRIINSMLKVNNTLTSILYKDLKQDEILLLVPRCLSKETRKELQELNSTYDGLNLHIASGGTEARKILSDIKPKGIVAVACERDLYAGVKDVPSNIPVIGIANKRPEGPCKNTLVNVNEIKESIDNLINNH